MSTKTLKSFGIATALTFGVFIAPATAQTSAPPPVRVEFTDSSAAGLAPTKRVAITSVIVSFQASVGARKEAGTGWFSDKSSSESLMAMPNMDPALQDAITVETYRQLKADLTAAGYDVVPEAEVAADASYREIIAKVGFVNHSRSVNVMGDAILVSPPSLTPYMPFTMEGGNFEVGAKESYLHWGKGWGKPATPGGFSLMTAATFYKLPGLEVALAKSLNAQVVKAFYVVNIGSTTAGRGGSWLTPNTLGGTASAFAQLSLLADQTRIAFRSPTGNAKWQKVNLNKPAPAKDGDVVVRLAETLLGGTDYFNVSSDGGHTRGDWEIQSSLFKFTYVASLNNPTAYQRDVNDMIRAANSSMVALVKR
jgi:hypothetical protein